MHAQRSGRRASTKTGDGRAGLQIEASEINNTVPDLQIASAESQRPNETKKCEGSRVTALRPQLGLGWLQCSACSLFWKLAKGWGLGSDFADLNPFRGSQLVALAFESHSMLSGCLHLLKSERIFP